jgi:probable phosphoglycerate mutase
MSPAPKSAACRGRIIYLMRHGETDGDGVKRYIGQSDLPLSLRGREQAEAWGRYFRHIPLAAVVSSDLTRARESAAIIAGQGGTPLKVKAGLREISLGSWEKMAFSEVQEKARGEFRKRGETIDTHRPPGGESFLDLQQRAVSTFYSIMAETAYIADDGGADGCADGGADGVTGDTGASADILIVAHAGLNRVLLCHILGMPVANLFCLAQDFACLNTLIREKRAFRVLGINQTIP